LVKRLRRRPLTAETGVRFPYELLTVYNSPTLKNAGNTEDSVDVAFFILLVISFQITSVRFKPFQNKKV
ncbi:MAG: hypothetical protein K2N85_00385, partial [Lachnospiraceae bacterium]|nr:hypothetical protein [Lachnospiraceae bacterium]